MNTYKELIVYKNSYQLSILMHKISLKLPYDVKDIANQIRRCSRSIPTNIAEGYSRNKSIKDRVNFLQTAMGSNNEMITHISFLKDLKCIKTELADKLMESYNVNGKRINRLVAFNKGKLINQTTK